MNMDINKNMMLMMLMTMDINKDMVVMNVGTKITCWLKEYAGVVSRPHDPKLEEVHLKSLVKLTKYMLNIWQQWKQRQT